MCLDVDTILNIVVVVVVVVVVFVVVSLFSLALLLLPHQVSSHTYLALERVFGFGTFILLWCVQFCETINSQCSDTIQQIFTRAI